MGQVKVDISMSLDGYIAGPHDDPELGLGEGGERLHEWLYGLASWRKPHGLAGGEANQDSVVVEEASRNIGAVVMGRRMFDNAVRAWGDNPPFHGPVFVLTHRARDPLVKGDTTFTFVTEGIASALEQAGAAAEDQDVALAGGANIIQQYLRAGLIDEIQIHLIPILLGGGIRLFADLDTAPIELERIRVIASPGVTHLLFHIRR